jgi:hypothetical protein
MYAEASEQLAVSSLQGALKMKEGRFSKQL